MHRTLIELAGNNIPHDLHLHGPLEYEERTDIIFRRTSGSLVTTSFGPTRAIVPNYISSSISWRKLDLIITILVRHIPQGRGLSPKKGLAYEPELGKRCPKRAWNLRETVP